MEGKRQEDEKRKEQDFYSGLALGVIAGIVVTLMFTGFWLLGVQQSQKTTDQPESSNYEVTSTQGDVEETFPNETEKVFPSYEVNNQKPCYGVDETKPLSPEKVCLKDENGEFTPEALELAKEYLDKYNNGDWTGFSVIDYDSGIKVGTNWGIICLEEEDTPIRTEERKICDEAIESYLSGEWDGTEKMTTGGHMIKLDEGGGYLLLDGKIAVGQINLDMPDAAYDLDQLLSYEYVPGKGTYALLDKKLVKFLRGEFIELPGDKLSWRGFQNMQDIYDKMGEEDAICYNVPRLIYNQVDGKLYLLSGDRTCTLDNSESYVYVFDEYDVSKIIYIGRLNFNHQYPGDVDISALLANSK